MSVCGAYVDMVSAVAGFFVKPVIIGFILLYFLWTYACAEIVVVMQYTAAVFISLHLYVSK